MTKLMYVHVLHAQEYRKILWRKVDLLKKKFEEKKINEYHPTLMYGELSIKISEGKERRLQQGFARKRQGKKTIKISVHQLRRIKITSTEASTKSSSLSKP